MRKLFILLSIVYSGCGSLWTQFTESSNLNERDSVVVEDTRPSLDASQTPETDAGLELDGGDGGLMDAGVDLPKSGPLLWERLAVPPTNAFFGVHGQHRHSVYLTASNGKVYHFDGNNWTLVWDTGGLSVPKAVWTTPDGAVFLVAEDRVFSCLQDCNKPQATFSSVFVPGVNLTAVCGRSKQEIFVVGFGSGLLDGKMYRWGGTNLTPLHGAATSSLPKLMSCWQREDGTVFATGASKVVRYQPSSQTVTMETVMPANGTLSHEWRAVSGINSTVFLAGASQCVATLGSTGAWKMSNDNVDYDGFYQALAGKHPSEWFAFGIGNSEAAMSRFDGKSWEVGPNAPQDTRINAAHALDANTYLLVGQLERATGGIVYLGTR